MTTRTGRTSPHGSPSTSRKRAMLLGVAPVLPLEQAIGLTMAWYRAHGQGADARQLCDADISGFETLLLNRFAAAPEILTT